jgi:cytochrome b6-f complex iron-sulfur subunit
MEEGKTGRRAFLGKLIGGGALTGVVATIGAVFAYFLPPHGVGSRWGYQQVKIAKVADIPVGKGKMALVGDEPVWVVHLARGFVGFFATCTHKGCIVEWEEKRGVFSCPCHDGLYDAHGNVIAGIPRRPLPFFRVDTLDGDVYALPHHTISSSGEESPRGRDTMFGRGPGINRPL